MLKVEIFPDLWEFGQKHDVCSMGEKILSWYELKIVAQLLELTKVEYWQKNHYFDGQVTLPKTLGINFACTWVAVKVRFWLLSRKFKILQVPSAMKPRDFLT